MTNNRGGLYEGKVRNIVSQCITRICERQEYKKYIKIFPHKQILSAQGYEPMNVDYLTFDAEELEVIDNMFGD